VRAVIGWAASVVLAAELVLTADLPGDRAIDRVVLHGEVSAAHLAATTLPALAYGLPPRASGAATLLPCDGPVASGDVSGSAVVARDRILAGDDSGALAEVEAAFARLRCARDVVRADDVARLHFLRGVALYDLADQEAAVDAFRRARSLLSGMAWDHATFGADGSEVFDLATPTGTALLRVLPLPVGGKVLIDGRAYPAGPDGLDVTVADHVVQLALDTTTTAYLRVDGPAALVLPAAVTDDVARWVQDPAWHGSLESVVDALAPETGWIALPEGTWRRNGGAYHLVAAHRPPPRRVAAATRVLPAGLVAIAAGATLVGLGGARRADAARWADHPDPAVTEADAHAAALRRAAGGIALQRAGAAITGAGVLVSGVTVTLLVVPGRAP
jgi:hypothetical protein